MLDETTFRFCSSRETERVVSFSCSIARPVRLCSSIRGSSTLSGLREGASPLCTPPFWPVVGPSRWPPLQVLYRENNIWVSTTYPVFSSCGFHDYFTAGLLLRSLFARNHWTLLFKLLAINTSVKINTSTLIWIMKSHSLISRPVCLDLRTADKRQKNKSPRSVTSPKRAEKATIRDHTDAKTSSLFSSTWQSSFYYTVTKAAVR